ncbi:MAG: DUF4174 domain-containing protein [Pseudomonadota bacterium]
MLQSSSHSARRVGVAAAAVLGASIAASPTESAAFGGYQWKKRPLIIFAPANDTAAWLQQRTLLTSRRRGLRERDMVVIAVLGDRVTTLVGRGPGRSAAALRRRFGVDKDRFRVLLVGKDGGVKLASSAPVSTKRLFGLIDSMPMRRREMRGG